jgi:hypothetical protein
MAKFNKTVNDYQMFDEPYAEMSEDRVNAEPSLVPYYDILIEYDWDNQGDHWRWVATADIDEVIDWAETIKEGEAQ